MKRLMAAVALLCLAFAVQAEAKKDKPLVQIGLTGSVTGQLEQVEEALRSEDYSEISLEKRSLAQQALNRIKIKMNGRDRLDDVSPQVRTEVFNDQQQIILILSQGREDSRMICRRERATGSNMPQRVCMTVAQRRQAEEAGRKLLRDSPNNNTYRP
ncbi:MAG: hypothetical protein GAK31_02037 [Stenotrophomonas maltophilia]|uniref:Secreted protein n=1 Tax=Stenotrophomonas maltophilia TaxID=40324 RepID=A0A7V8JLB1_STEMA|nr:MAG: hypothetical protein GAK31_02037 [Stenotrophomonas maltophilia]